MLSNVKTHIHQEVATITFFHPKSNSLPGELLRELTYQITSAGNNPIVKVIIIKSEGDKTFCGGASFDDLIAIKNFEDGKKFFLTLAEVINAMRNVPKFIIARIQGKAVGGGVGLAASADYAFAVKDASIRLSELALGIGPFVVGPAVERKIGNSAFTSLTINPTVWKTAEWAREKGLYAEVVDSVAEMDAAIQSLAEKLAHSNPEAMAQLKKVMWSGTEHWDKLLVERAEMSGRFLLSEFTQKALKS
ncbi:MAG: enoyl-CoA hydratase, partial [Bacteroidetes bacterium RIFCSPLOWO2_02_FULL_36_8]